MNIDPRAELKGLAELKEARTAYRRLQTIIESLPAPFHSRGDMGYGNEMPLFAALCKTRCAEEMRQLKEAVTAASAIPEILRLSYKHYTPEKIHDNEWQHHTFGRDLGEKVRAIEKALSTLCGTLETCEKVCRLAEQLETAIKEAQPQQGYQPHSFHFSGASSFHRATQEKLEDLRRNLEHATNELAGQVQAMLMQTDLEGHEGLLIHLADSWKAAPPVELPRDRPSKGRSKQPLEDRVKTAMFAMHRDGADYSNKAEIARRLDLSKSVLSKPEAITAFNETLQLLRDSSDTRNDSDS